MLNLLWQGMWQVDKEVIIKGREKRNLSEKSDRKLVAGEGFEPSTFGLRKQRPLFPPIVPWFLNMSTNC